MNSNIDPVKMLIVDDERLIREGMKQILPWSELGVKIIGDAENGLIAMEMAHKEKPDIALLDIRMPEINGLQLISKLKLIIPDVVFIILSGYDDFEYAKESISLGVFHYLVKPVQKDELEEVIQRSLQHICKKRLREKQEQELNERYDQALPILKDNLILNILYGNIGGEDLHDKLDDLNIDIHGCFHAVVCFKMLAGLSGAKPDLKKLVVLKNWLDEYFTTSGMEGFKYYSLINNNSLVSVLSYGDYNKFDNGMHRKKVLELYEYLCEKTRMYYDFHLVCGVGSCKPETEGVSDSFCEAMKCIEFKMLHAGFDIIFIEDIASISVNPILISNENKKKLLKSIQDCNLQEVENVLLSIKKEIEKSKFISMGTIYYGILEILISCMRFLQENSFRVEDIYNTEILSYDYLSGFNSLDDLFLWMIDFYKSLSVKFNDYKFNSPRIKLVEDIKSYVLKNIGSDVNLADLSNHLYYNPSYISRVFKEVLNKNFIDFVTEVKINYAKDLILNTNLKTYEICDKVGYKDYKHFAALFKKITGMSPKDFKLKGCIENDAV